ncbi:MAG: hypothetical protein L0I62_01045 [Gammaproteobacteria bacterium]|nr:hypothetical protein [Gammaproteobacteria bacterium]
MRDTIKFDDVERMTLKDHYEESEIDATIAAADHVPVIMHDRPIARSPDRP